MRFNETDLHVISNALRVAAERFKEHAEYAEAPERLRTQFNRQSNEATRVYDAISQESGIAS